MIFYPNPVNQTNFRPIRRGYDFMTYTIEPIKLLPHMLAEFKTLGGKMITGRKVTDLGEVAEEFGADVLINCTGVWAG